ncbi:MAG: DUF4167 domain-containing protein [Pseudomonadota bacterium]
MRSSKSRSRSKSNRNRPSGNIVNRVFDSNGPEGKVRGTPQQVIDKYNQLARDAQLSGDRVALENFQQHAEHYVRMLNEAQREQREAQERRDAQDRERREARGEQPGGGGQPQNQHNDQGGDQGGDRSGDQGQDNAPAVEVIEVASQSDSDAGLVETPESKPQRNRRARKPKADAQPPQDAAPEAAPQPTPDTEGHEAAE